MYNPDGAARLHGTSYDIAKTQYNTVDVSKTRVLLYLLYQSEHSIN
jgi:hypothetical protein